MRWVRTWGATNWHGGSFDPVLGYLFFNTLDLADVGKLSKAGPESKMAYSKGGFARFWNPNNFWPCQKPPWGEMVAINVNTGEYAWRVPFGIVPELEAKGVHNTGALNMGGSATSATGLVFMARQMTVISGPLTANRERFSGILSSRQEPMRRP